MNDEMQVDEETGSASAEGIQQDGSSSFDVVYDAQIAELLSQLGSKADLILQEMQEGALITEVQENVEPHLEAVQTELIAEFSVTALLVGVVLGIAVAKAIGRFWR